MGIINTVRSFQTEQEITKVLNTLTENNGSFGKKPQKLRPIKEMRFLRTVFDFSALFYRVIWFVSKDTSPMFLINDDEVARYALTVRPFDQ